MDWKQYSLAFIVLGRVGTVLLYGILRLQKLLPGSIQACQTTPVTPDLAMSTAISFSTTTTWQAYGGKNTYVV